MTQFDELLREMAEQMARQKKLRSMLRELDERKQQLDARESELAALRTNEQRDVDRLEGRSLAAFFYGMFGSREERLDQERQEAYDAAVRHDAVVRERSAVEQEIRSRKGELASLDGCEQRYAEAFSRKAELLRQSDPVHSEQIIRLEERVAACEGQIMEIDEAVAAGQLALGTTDSILSSLSSAEGWGNWDLFLNGGLWADLAKHGHLDEAQEQVELLQIQLLRFKTELSDVEIQSDTRVQIDGFLRFADYFFDGLFADWAVLDHIHHSQEQVSETRIQIQSVLRHLDSMRDASEEERRQAKDALDTAVLSA